MNSPALPSSHNPKASYVINSFAEKQSCNSQTPTYDGLTPVYENTYWAALLLISYPAKFIKLYSVKVFSLSVVICIPNIWTA